ncbi:MAG: 3-carboxy-cis,cis-muconate cycloisomerase [Candidatus Acidiferrales bacterium]
MTLLGPLFRWEAVDDLFSDRARVQGVLDFEAALARADARAGVIPANAAAAIAAKCRTELFDMNALARATAIAGNPAIPLVKELTKLVAKDDKEAARFVHWGATSQDAIDTGFALQLRSALEHIEAELEKFSNALAQLASKHRNTVTAGRTWIQQALPTTFGLRAAGWLDAVTRHRRRLTETRGRALVLQFGGAVGTLAALGGEGLHVSKALGEELHLRVPEIPWHSHRDRIAEVASTLGLCTGTLGKIARDISLLAQTEVAEVFEPAAEGRGGSSTLPHKRNPVTSAVVLAAATRVPGLVSSMLAAMIQEQERGLGGWHTEWETMPEIIGLTAGALHHLTDTVGGLEIDSAKMAENLDVTRGLIFAEAVQMALSNALGRQAAHELVESVCKRAQAQKRHLREVLAEDAVVTKHLTREQLNRLFDSRQYLGAADAFIDRVLAAHSSHRPKVSDRSD